MSVNKNTYGIIGFDLTKHRDELITEDFYDSAVYEELTYNRSAGKTQMFTDPMNGNYLYFGYIFFEDNGDCVTTKSLFKAEDIVDIAKDVADVFKTYFDTNTEMLEPQVIMFNDFS